MQIRDYNSPHYKYSAAHSFPNKSIIQLSTRVSVRAGTKPYRTTREASHVAKLPGAPQKDNNRQQNPHPRGRRPWQVADSHDATTTPSPSHRACPYPAQGHHLAGRGQPPRATGWGGKGPHPLLLKRRTRLPPAGNASGPAPRESPAGPPQRLSPCQSSSEPPALLRGSPPPPAPCCPSSEALPLHRHAPSSLGKCLLQGRCQGQASNLQRPVSTDLTMSKNCFCFNSRRI